VRNPSIMKTLPVCMKFKYEDVEVMKEEYWVNSSLKPVIVKLSLNI
jgi:hypothetical protein